jgi:hypothetical protein
LKDYRPAQSYDFDRDFYRKNFIVFTPKLPKLRLVHFVKINDNNIIVESGSIGTYELESDSNLMLFFREVPTKVNFLKGATAEVLVLDPGLIGILKD